MILAISVSELTKEKGNWIAMVKWGKYDGGNVGAPGAIKYGKSKDDAYDRLKNLLEERGHEIKE
ncbi:MAG: hypothetical protein COA36_16730 [Desulfotalea sp.]|nr:MAG: hypothetical protein COA36_16730 [Desulfotalea sp.]